MKVNKKEDHLSPTKIEEPKSGHVNEPNLSHDELQNRLDLYSRTNGNERTYFDVQKIKDKYEKEIRQIEGNRTKADIHYAQGIRSGLPHARYESIQITYERHDQNLRNNVAQEAKAYYQKNSSLGKAFEAGSPMPEKIKKTFDKAKNKGMDREK